MEPYATVEQANSWLDADPIRREAWEALSDTDKARYLIAATRRIDLIDFPGRKTNATQSHAWPRVGAVCEGRALADDEIPVQVQNATIILAGDIAIDVSAAETFNDGNVKRVKAGSTELEFFRPTGGSYSLSRTSPDAFLQLSCLVGSISSLTKSTVTGLESYDLITHPTLDEGMLND